MSYTEFSHYIEHRKRDLEKAFDRIDTDHGGKINCTELVGAERCCFGCWLDAKASAR